jgi:hypothetical protein
MAYNKSEIYKEALDLSINPNLFFIQDIIDYLRVSKSTFYEFFPDGSDELDVLKLNLYGNKIEQKVKLRKRLGEGSGSELIALYKLIGNDEERKSLSTNWNENTQTGNIKITPMEWFKTPEKNGDS